MERKDDSHVLDQGWKWQLEEDWQDPISSRQ